MATHSLQYSCLENPMERGAWQATVHGVIKSQTRLKWLSMHACTYCWILKSTESWVRHPRYWDSTEWGHRILGWLPKLLLLKSNVQLWISQSEKSGISEWKKRHLFRVLSYSEHSVGDIILQLTLLWQGFGKITSCPPLLFTVRDLVFFSRRQQTQLKTNIQTKQNTHKNSSSDTFFFFAARSDHMTQVCPLKFQGKDFFANKKIKT